MPTTTNEALSIGVPIVGDIVNAVATGAQNKKSRRFAREMYDRQRADAIADWNMQNDYNSPAGQMARLRAAGLNPNLVYGNGADAQSQGTVRSSGVPGAQFDAPRFSSGDVMSQYFNAKIQQAQYDNLRAQNTVATQDALLKAAQVIQTTAATGKTKADTASTEFDNQLKSELKQTSIEAARAGVQKTLADTAYTLDSNDRAKAQNAASIQEALERILRSRAERATIPLQRREILARIGNINKDAQLKQLDINLKRNGIQPGDPLWMRMLGQLLERWIGNTEKHEKGKKQGAEELRRYYPATP